MFGILSLLFFTQWTFAQSNRHSPNPPNSPTSLLLSDTSVAIPVPSELLNIGYGGQTKAAISSAVTSLDAAAFNQGLISDPALLLQGKIAGLQVYNRGGDPNRHSLVRIRGASLGANPNPLIVIDGIIGADLESVDPNDVARITVLKNTAANAIYGLQAASGVILIETKKADYTRQGLQLTYHGQGAITQLQSQVPVMDADQFLATGGVDLGASTNWADEITQTGRSQSHGLALAGASAKSSFRLAANYRDVEGILRKSGFERLNTRLNFNTKMLNDRLLIDVNGAFTYRMSSFSFPEAFRYAVITNPTAPIFGADAPFPFDSEQYGGYFETLGLFDSFNPVSLLEQNSDQRQDYKFTSGLRTSYQLSDKWMITGRLTNQVLEFKERAFYSTTSLFRGNATSPIRKGRVDYSSATNNLNLYEAFFTYNNRKKEGGLELLAGYSRQKSFGKRARVSFADLITYRYDHLSSFTPPPINLNPPLLEPQPYTEASQGVTPEVKIDAIFARAMKEWTQSVFLNLSIRGEKFNTLRGSSPWTIFSALSLGVDINKYLRIDKVEQFKLRAGWGLTGSILGRSGSSFSISNIIITGSGGNVPVVIISANNPELKGETQSEFNLGLDFVRNRFQATIDWYSRQINDLLVLREVDPVFGIDPRYENGGQMRTQGAELSLAYELIRNDKIKWQTTLVGSSYKTVLEDYFTPAEVRANLGAPGQNGVLVQRLAVGEQVGQIWGPVFTGVNTAGEPVFADLNKDGIVITGAGDALSPNADFQVLGQGTPAFELGWGHHISVGSWSLNAFFRSALGHSLVNTNRLFYEPNVMVQASYNNVNTELRDPALTTASFSSLYVERADFLKLDNLTLAKRFSFKDATKRLTLSLTGQNLWVWTNYTGADPEPALVDYGTADNGGQLDYNNYDSASPGMDRRYSYWPASTLVFGLKLEL